VLPTLPLNLAADEGRIIAALRAAGATVMARYGASLRRAAVAEWEVRLPVPDTSGAWRLVVSSPTGVYVNFKLPVWVLCDYCTRSGCQAIACWKRALSNKVYMLPETSYYRDTTGDHPKEGY
jgi:hypothetical protein